MITRGFLASFLGIVSIATAAQAQMSDVPRFDTNGDFFSARVQGNRGMYPHWQWVVVETDNLGLNCRSDNGDVIVVLAYGAVVDSVFEGDDAISLVNGQPWLKVNADLRDVQRRVVDDFAVAYTCYVRANNQYIVPLNPDTQ
ncbi:hypothetical protein D0962_24305 [Leptolyngbyaceae cyanobacterium CCMR0082]|nr:hypothetical protein [Adonisia turfae]MDV3352678.1 hypothetical protein [Leptothoe sp. LEGE 181152]NEZ65843.1 hypothetical protein [Adonisia turfae CCMR0082]